MPLSDEELFHVITYLKNDPPKVSQALALLEGPQPPPLGWMNKAREAMVGFLGRMNQAKSMMEGIDQRVQALGAEINQNPPPSRLFDIKTMLLHEVGQFRQASDDLQQEIKKQESGLKQVLDTNLPGWETDVGACFPVSSVSSPVEESSFANPVSEVGTLSESSGLCDTWVRHGLPSPQDFADRVAPGIASGQPSVLVVIKLANIHRLLVRTPSNTLERLAQRIQDILKLEAKSQDAFGVLDAEHMGLYLCNIRLPLATALARRVASQLAIKVKGLDGRTYTLDTQTTALVSKKGEDNHTLLKRGLAFFNADQK
ncbi:MAG: hypothetical protein HQL07_01050 [Nitrospirae bacterium]|nr:hypothetical protein [Magnetococcales bacterium]HAT48733.1 hypothetical protein [Alphaproteobacteria bacterium]